MSAPPSAPTANGTSATPTAPAAQQPSSGAVLPDASVLLAAAKLAMAQDKPILLDYYAETAAGTAFLGEDETTNERMLVKSQEEFTSLIQKTYKVKDDYIVMTENSIYLTHKNMKKRRIQASSLKQD
jgi:hypothetical protein